MNVIEALLKGVMYTDEPCASLDYLFSPKFLSSDRARISVQVAAKCVPYMKVYPLFYFFIFLLYIYIFFKIPSLTVGRVEVKEGRKNRG